MLRKLLICFIATSLLCSVSSIKSQSLRDLSFAEDATLEVMTWNLQTFPKLGQATMDSVSEIIRALGVDLIAVQEVDDTIRLKQMLDNTYNWKGYFKSSYYTGLGYIYNPDAIQIIRFYEIYTTSSYWRAFPRAPLVIEFTFGGEEFVVMNNHFKCCGDGILDPTDDWDEETRRLEASSLLKQYIDNNLSNKRVMVVGDLNDQLLDSPLHNSFQPFLNDPGNYFFADMSIAQGSSSEFSYPSWPSHLDHILMTNEIAADFALPASSVQTIKVDEYMASFWQYDHIITDHRPVAVKILTGSTTAIVEPKAAENEVTCYPNPFTDRAMLFFPADAEMTEIHIYNSSGLCVEQLTLQPLVTSIIWQPSGLAPGLYFAKWMIEGGSSSLMRLMYLK